MLTADDLLLSDDELVALTGYKRASEQLAELHRQGFSRARRDRLGRLILERGHYLGVLAGNRISRPIDISSVVPKQVFNASSAKRAEAIAQRTPPWADLNAIEAVYEQAKRLSRETGSAHHVDHEIPLQGRRVSGLHVHTNLRVMVGRENVRKGNKFEPC